MHAMVVSYLFWLQRSSEDSACEPCRASWCVRQPAESVAFPVHIHNCVGVGARVCVCVGGACVCGVCVRV